MKKKRKWLHICLIICLILPILFFYNAFNGNPISKWVATSTLDKYLQETYPGQEFYKDYEGYNFKFGNYLFHVNKIGDEDQKPYEFEVTGMFQPTVTYDEIYYDNLDEPLMGKWGKEAASEIETVLQDIGKIVRIEVRMEVLQGSYDWETNWNKELKLEKPMDLYVLMDAKNMTKESMAQSMIDMQKKMNAEGYTYDYVSVNANILDDPLMGEDDTGYVKYAGSFTPNGEISSKKITEENQ